MKRHAIIGTGAQAGYVVEMMQKLWVAVELVEPIDDSRVGQEFYGIEVGHSLNTFVCEQSPDEFEVIVALGDLMGKRAAVNVLKHHGFHFFNAQSMVATAAGSSWLGSGSIVCRGAVLQHGVYVGDHCIVHSGAVVEHDCSFGDFVNIGPGAVLAGSVKVATGAFIGANATILPNIVVGPNSVVGAGAVVTRDVPEGVTVIGSPAKIPTVVNWR